MQIQHAWCCGSADDCDSTGVTTRSKHSILRRGKLIHLFELPSCRFFVVSFFMHHEQQVQIWSLILSFCRCETSNLCCEKCFCIKFSSTLSSSRSANGNEFPYMFSIIICFCIGMYIYIYTHDSWTQEWHRVFTKYEIQLEIKNKGVYSHSFTPKKVRGMSLLNVLLFITLLNMCHMIYAFSRSFLLCFFW